NPSLVVLLVAVGIFIISSVVMMPFVPEDAYISFRYAEHLADGDGITFNVGGPPVEGYSNFLWLFVLAAVYKAGADLPTTTPYIGILLGILNLFVLWKLFKKRGLPPLEMLLPLVVFATAGPFLMYSVSGMEMTLFSLLLLLAMYFADGVFGSWGTRPIAWTMGIGVLLGLCRPEGVIVFPIIVLFAAWCARRRLERRTIIKRLGVASLMFAALVVAYNLWRYGYFHEWLPPPFMSKAGGGTGLVFAWEKNVKMFFYTKGHMFPPAGYYFLALTVAAFVGMILSKSGTAHKRTERLAFGLAVVLMAVYFNFIDWMPGMRYHSVVIGLLLLPAVHVQSVFPASMWSRPGRKERITLAAALALVLLTSFSVTASLKMIGSKLEEGNRECLIPLGQWLAQVFPPDALLAMSDVGAVPYYSRLRTLDIHVESLTDLYIAKNGFSQEYVLENKPDVVVLSTRGVYSAKMDPIHFAMMKSPGFGALFKFLGTVRYLWYDDRGYWIFIPKNMTLTREQLESFPKGIGTMRRIEP
ncbi:MAG: hypothetical protein P8181_07160, partial [bacterium]